MCLFLFLFASCVSKQPSHEEWNLAQAAFRSAQESEAKRFAPKFFSKARILLKRGEQAYIERYFDEATDYFRKSRYYAEKAESKARLKMFQEGEMAP